MKRAKQAKTTFNALFEALPLDWDTTPPPSAPPLPAIGDPHPSSVHATSQDLERLRANKVDTNIVKSTGTWVNRFNKWRTERHIAPKLEEIPKEHLVGILQLFFFQKYTKTMEQTMDQTMDQIA